MTQRRYPADEAQIVWILRNALADTLSRLRGWSLGEGSPLIYPFG